MADFELTIPTIDEFKALKERIDNISLLGINDFLPTDYALARGARSDGLFWTQSAYNKCFVYVAKFQTDSSQYDNSGHCISGIWPILKPKSLEFAQLLNNQEEKRSSEVSVVTFGEYPTSKVSEEENTNLELLYSYNKLKETGKTYTLEAQHSILIQDPFQEEKIKEYSYNNKRYVRVPYLYYGKYNIVPQEIKYFWFEVEPITWYRIHNFDFYVAKQILVGGIPFDDRNLPYDGNFANTNLKWYIDSFLLEEISPLVSKTLSSILDEDQELQKIMFKKRLKK